MSDILQAMDCSPTGSSVREISQARTLGWVPISFFRSSQLRDQIHISCLAGRFFTTKPPWLSSLISPALTSCPWQPSICAWFLWVCFCSVPHVSKIIQHYLPLSDILLHIWYLLHIFKFQAYHCEWHVSFLYGCVTFHCICKPHFLYPFIHWWKIRLFL